MLSDLRTIAESLFSDIASISCDVEGVSRPAFSKKEMGSTTPSSLAKS